jgi:hypothetical protein
MPSDLQPFSYSGEEQLTYLSTEPSLSQARKRECPSSESMTDQSHSKRIYQFSDPSSEIYEFRLSALKSSPPLVPQECSDTDNDTEDDDYATMTFTLNNSSFLSTFHTETPATEVIHRAINDGKSNILLENLGLQEVPEEIADLKNLVCVDSDTGSLVPSISIFLAKNSISSLCPELFSVHNITVLSLRMNLLRQIPPAIGTLTRLTDLYLGGNMLQYLPSEILALKNLSVLTIYPNDFIAAPKPNNCGLSVGDGPVRYAVSTKNIRNLAPSHYVRRLDTICLDAITTNLSSHREVDTWSLPFAVNNLVHRAIDSFRNGVKCGVCGKFMVDGIGYVLEWWDGFAKIKDLVARRNICSTRCFEQWKNGVDPSIHEE